MRIRSLVTVALMLPAVVSAQRIGGRAGTRIGGRIPPAELPPTAGPLAREMSYVPRPYSVESYMFISYMRQPMGLNNSLSNYGTTNIGTRLDYRLNEYFSLTGDMTTPMFYAPATNRTLELGTRFLPLSRSSEGRVLPFMDLRLGYVFSNESFAYASDPTAVNPQTVRGARYGQGMGSIGGVGSDFRLTRSLYLTTGAMAQRTRMTVASSTFQARPSDHSTYWQTGYRFALGLRFNPMKATPVE